jgi:hypothetical protein
MSDVPDIEEDGIPVPAAGWDAEDAALLREMAQIGMGLLRDLGEEVRAHAEARRAGEAEPLSPAAASAVAGAFARLSRGVRMALALKAWARAGGAEAAAAAAGAGTGAAAGAGRRPAGPTRPHTWRQSAIVDFDFRDPEMPHLLDIPTREAFRCQRIRDELGHAITDPAHTPAEVERLREALERRIEIEREREHFLERTVHVLVERIALDLGLSGVWRTTRKPDGGPGNGIIARRGEDEMSPAIPEPPGMPRYTCGIASWDAEGPEPPPQDNSWSIAEHGAVALNELSMRKNAWRRQYGPKRGNDTS